MVCTKSTGQPVSRSHIRSSSIFGSSSGTKGAEAADGSELEEAMTEHGVAVNSGEFDGLSTAECKAAVVAKLEDANEDVRAAAMATLGKLPAEVLATHVPALLATLEDSDERVRWAAVEGGRSSLVPEWGRVEVGAVKLPRAHGGCLGVERR